ncbi:MAG: hypothetical protein IJQ87_01500 [Clostridia bacterium]|nr:hypothetical protein [Clostridia bacterium]
MVDLFSLIKDTRAYKTVAADKAAGRLSHAYLFISSDGVNSGEYLKIFAKLIMSDFADERADGLIDNGYHPDVLTFPKNGEAVLKEDVAKIIEESFLKPVESDNKLFLINNGESMNATSQNKLLKTLEEPPRGVHILIHATTEYPLLSTFKSRVKKLVIPPFPADKLISALKSECADIERLKNAVYCGDGTVGGALALYGDENLSETIDAAADTFCNMKTSREVLESSDRVMRLSDGVKGFLSVMELICRDFIVYVNGGDTIKNRALLMRVKDAEGFTAGALIYIADRIADAKRRLSANGNPQAVLERFLFAFLEGKHKWRKL